MKKIISAVLLCISSSFLNNSFAMDAPPPDGCPMKSDERLVCEAIMCTVGIAIPESHSKCVQVQTDFAIYLATLGFWDSPPSCQMRDLNCETTGNAQDVEVNYQYCNKLTGEEKNICIKNVSNIMGE